MELGGKSPAIVLPGADLKLAANNVRQPRIIPRVIIMITILEPVSRITTHQVTVPQRGAATNAD